ncbi:hypothetical protein ES703_124609 [subsurface metagenome]
MGRCRCPGDSTADVLLEKVFGNRLFTPLLTDKPAAVIIGDVEESSIAGLTLSAGIAG